MLWAMITLQRAPRPCAVALNHSLPPCLSAACESLPCTLSKHLWGISLSPRHSMSIALAMP